MNFGEKLIEARKTKNLSQEDLGKLVGIDKRIISRYETNKTAPSIEVAKKIAEALNVSLDFLTELNNSLFINDTEMTRLLSDYDKLDNEEKTTITKIIRAFKFYSKIESTQQEMSI
jgi:transcriptional regulator with XRE-family HTH domain